VNYYDIWVPLFSGKKGAKKEGKTGKT
jgi:hypothetical protein